MSFVAIQIIKISAPGRMGGFGKPATFGDFITLPDKISPDSNLQAPPWGSCLTHYVVHMIGHGYGMAEHTMGVVGICFLF